MGTSFKRLTFVVSALALVAVCAAPASAKCTRLAFSVNDYGKDGPTKDAKRLLDKYIAEWTAERGISGYRTGPKSVSCELFLDFGFFDEHTCRAEATVCWDGSTPSGAATSAKKKSDTAPAPVAETKKEQPAPASTASDESSAPAAPAQAAVKPTAPSAATAPVKAAAPAAAPAQAVVTSSTAPSAKAPVAGKALDFKGTMSSESLGGGVGSSASASKAPVVE